MSFPSDPNALGGMLGGLQQQMEEQGFHFHYLSNVQQVEKTGEGAFRVHLTPSKEGGP